MNNTAKSRLIDSLVVANFLPGQILIQENDSHADRMFVILSGVCNLAVFQTQDKFSTLEHEDNPLLAIRERELGKLRNCNMLGSLQHKFVDHNKPSLMKNKSLSSVQKNGYLSKTLKSIQLGQKQQGEWVGEELLGTNVDKVGADFAGFCYSVIAQTKVMTYCIRRSDIEKLPYRLKQVLIQNAKLRRESLAERTIDQYSSLKTIKRKVQEQDREIEILNI